MFASDIYAGAPLGAVIRYSNGQPRPPERFRNKLAAWRGQNGEGHLISKSPGRLYGSYVAHDSFTLEDAEYASQGIVVLRTRSIHQVDSALRFEIVSTPAAGEAA